VLGEGGGGEGGDGRRQAGRRRQAGGGYDVALYESFRPARHIFRLHSLPRCSRAAARRRLRLRPALAASHDGVDACASGSASANTCGVVYVGLAYPSPLAPSATHAGRQGRRGRQRCKAVGVVASSRQTETPTRAPPPVPRAPGTRQARAARAARARGASSLVRARTCRCRPNVPPSVTGCGLKLTKARGVSVNFFLRAPWTGRGQENGFGRFERF
jgi:hypothetical protein